MAVIRLEGVPELTGKALRCPPPPPPPLRVLPVGYPASPPAATYRLEDRSLLVFSGKISLEPSESSKAQGEKGREGSDGYCFDRELVSALNDPHNKKRTSDVVLFSIRACF